MTSRRTIGARLLGVSGTVALLLSLLALPVTASDAAEASHMAQFVDDAFRIEHRAELGTPQDVGTPHMAQFVDDAFRIEHRAELGATSES